MRPTRLARHRGAGACARCFRDRRHPPQHPVPVDPDGPSALAGGPALDRLHRRGISAAATPIRSRPARRPRGPGGRRRRHRCHAELPQTADLRARCACRGRPCSSGERGREIGEQEFRFDVVGPGGHRHAIGFDDGRAVQLASAWRPGEPVWHGTIDGAALAVQVTPMPNGVLLSHAGAFAEARVYTLRGGRTRRGSCRPRRDHAAASICCVRCRACCARCCPAGQDVKAGEPLAVVEAMKMENVLRAERDGTVAASTPGGRQPGGGRRHPGFRMSPPCGRRRRLAQSRCLRSAPVGSAMTAADQSNDRLKTRGAPPWARC